MAAAGENGCGYEASLEAWYRFLVDPEPPSAVQLRIAPHTPLNSCLTSGGKRGTQDIGANRAGRT